MKGRGKKRETGKKQGKKRKNRRENKGFEPVKAKAQLLALGKTAKALETGLKKAEERKKKTIENELVITLTMMWSSARLLENYHEKAGNKDKKEKYGRIAETINQRLGQLGNRIETE